MIAANNKKFAVLPDDTNNECFQVSTKGYRHHSKMIHAQKKRVGWYEKWDRYDDWKRIPTIKTSETRVMEEYFEFVFPVKLERDLERKQRL